MNKPHKHAQIIKAWADGHDIEFKGTRGWTIVVHPTFSEATEYRIRPKVIRINGLEIPEPERAVPAENQIYYYPSVTDSDWVSGFSWHNDSIDKRILEAGLLHLTHANAWAHARAIFEPTKA